MAKKPFLKLRRLIEDQGLEQQELAAIVGISTRTLSKRLNAPEDDGGWLFPEMTAICKVVGDLLEEQIGEYFFPEVK